MKNLVCIVGNDVNRKQSTLLSLFEEEDNSEEKKFISCTTEFLSAITSFSNSKVLYIDLPEFKAFPSDQLLIARQIIRLVHIDGKKIIFTTNSDYIIQHINNMIKLNNNKDRETLMLEYEYDENDLLDSEEIQVCEINIDNEEKELVCGKYGFVVPSFNFVINKLCTEIFTFQEEED